MHVADYRAEVDADYQAADARLVIPMRWLAAPSPEPRRVIDVDAPAPHGEHVAATANGAAAVAVDVLGLPLVPAVVPPAPRPEMAPRPTTAPRLAFVGSPESDDAAASAGIPTALAGWAHVISTSHDACLLVNDRGRVLAVSPSASALLGDVTPSEMVGRHLLDGILHFADFDAGQRGSERGATYADRIPPLLAVATAGPARGLLRITASSGEVRMVDALAAPVHDSAGTVLGAVSFVSAVSFD